MKDENHHNHNHHEPWSRCLAIVISVLLPKLDIREKRKWELLAEPQQVSLTRSRMGGEEEKKEKQQTKLSVNRRKRRRVRKKAIATGGGMPDRLVPSEWPAHIERKSSAKPSITAAHSTVSIVNCQREKQLGNRWTATGRFLMLYSSIESQWPGDLFKRHQNTVCISFVIQHWVGMILS